MRLINSCSELAHLLKNWSDWRYSNLVILSTSDISKSTFVGNVLGTPWMHLRILFCVTFSFSWLVCAVLIQTGDAYVILGRMMVLYNTSLFLVDSIERRHRSGYIALKLFIAFVLHDSICLVKFNLWSMITPRYVTSVRKVISDPFKYRSLDGVRLFDWLNLNRIKRN